MPFRAGDGEFVQRTDVADRSQLPRWSERDETRIITASEGWQSGRMRRS